MMLLALRSRERAAPLRFVREAREAATSVFEGFRQTFESIIETRLNAIQSRVERLVGAQDDIRSSITGQQQTLRGVRDDLHSFFWLVSTGADVSQARLIRYVPARIYLSDPVPNRGVLRTLSDAVQQLADDVGLELADEFPEETGSWWKRVILRTKDAASHDEVRERLVKAERALEVTYLDKPQAEANKNQADAASSLINALAKTSHACIQVGSLLIVKATKADGESCVVARTLTPRELKKLEENQAILRRPEEILEWLGRSDSDMMVESDATKRLTSG